MTEIKIDSENVEKAKEEFRKMARTKGATWSDCFSKGIDILCGPKPEKRIAYTMGTTFKVGDKIEYFLFVNGITHKANLVKTKGSGKGCLWCSDGWDYINPDAIELPASFLNLNPEVIEDE